VRTRTILAAAAVITALIARSAPVQSQDRPAPADPLPSWNDGPAKKAILDFVGRVTKEGGADFVPVPERIATFDNDGTLWCEMPMYVQVVFALDRVKALADKNPDWKTKEPFASVLKEDMKGVLASGEKGLVELITATHAGMTTEEFEAIVGGWLRTVRHPKFKRPYTDLVYQPMLDLLAYLRASGFKTFIVSGGGIEFMRPFAPRVYGIPPEQIVGSSVRTKYEMVNGKPAIVRLPEMEFVDDKAGKPVGIAKFIGRRPVMAFGNSDGDFEMLQWTTAGPGPRFGLIVHHTDADREYAYDRKSLVGRLDKALDEAPKAGWVVVDMRKDWKIVFPSENR
jgi:phosphoserine phosphatase